MWERERKLKNI